MANLPENASWPSGIYQIETTDPVVGGPDGIDNVQAKQLANRTAWLKQYADEVAQARGDKASLGARLDLLQALAPEHQVAIIAATQEALGLAGVLSREIDVIRNRVLAQGEVVLKNKHVISGMVLSKSGIRALDLSQSGTVGSGSSRAWIDGLTITLADEATHVSVPTNETDEAVTYYAFLHDGPGGYGVGVAQQVPDDGLVLYRLDLPANDTAGDLSAVTLTDLRVVRPQSGWWVDAAPFVSVAFAEALPAADYGVELEVEGATNLAGVGALTAYDKARNGFKIKASGSADNIRIRWTLLNPRYQ
ncbi:hypothetical protein [Sediminimonas sp.]|uniref:hypothetical protein n=1 Tax=Sediminimonas sp. TaxID=2823379 RepID=UPI0025DE4DC1|nr:hypothetical protein [Sediminimonas sp.]